MPDLHDLRGAHDENVARVTRRRLFGSAGQGIGAVALASLLGRDADASSTASPRRRRCSRISSTGAWATASA